MAEALIRAAQRGIQCRVMADDLGSRDFIRSQLWRDMESAGVQITAALPIGSILMRILKGRIDLRNHRKIVVIDNQITYCGSQNCADAEFRVKPKYAPWVDAVLRLEGPIASQQQRIFISDWLTKKDEDLSELLARPLKAKNPGFPAQAFGTGPTIRYSAMPEMFDSLLFLAQKEVLITTPYYVPDESLQSAICTAALRGIEVTMILPAKNDSFVVGAASHSYYESLLKAGVKIFEFEGGLLHTKSLTVDGVVTLIGSANMDRRSFDLNYENNIILYDAPLTTEVRELQNQYMAQSRQVSLDHVLAWPRRRRLWNNTIAMLGPIL
jgi:cardiolipin synthase